MNLNELVRNTYPQTEYLHWFCIDTPIYITTKEKNRNGSVDFQIEEYVLFNFLDTEIIWLNTEIGVKGGRSATVIVPCTADSSTAYKTGKKFLSYLATKSNMRFIELLARTPQKIGKSCVQYVYKTGCAPRHKDDFASSIDPIKYSEKYWVALAFNREAINSNSVYHKFLSYWKILEIALEHENKIKRYVEERLGKGKYNKLFVCRNKSAHILLKNSKKLSTLENPDDPEAYGEVQRNMSNIIKLTSTLISNYSDFSNIKLLY